MNNQLPRREFLKMLAGTFSAGAIDWNAFPINSSFLQKGNEFDAVIIGSGLGGLCCAAAFARQGFKPLVLEQHDKPGGYATAFSRPGGFLFDVSLHSTGTGERNGVYNMIQGFPEITEVEFLPHPNLFRAIYPHHDIRAPQKDLQGFVGMLIKTFPEEQVGIEGLFADMRGLATDIQKLSRAGGQVDMSKFQTDFPFLAKFHTNTWGEMLDSCIKNQQLKGIISAQWAYYGLPPSKLSCFYYALPFLGYFVYGGYYPKGRSQDISNALARFIKERGGTIMLNARVDKILTNNHEAVGVRTADGTEFKSRVVVSNANAFDTFQKMMDEQAFIADYVAQWKQYGVSISSFQVFLGLKEDLIKKTGIGDAEIFFETSYDPEESYQRALAGDVENGGFAATLYDNIYTGYSPEGKNTLNVMVLQGYDPWVRFEKDYLKGEKTEYRKVKERMADILIEKAEHSLLPGLSKTIEVREIGTPLTNLRYTGNYRGAIYGWDQTVNNSGNRRIGHKTPIKNLYLAGAWSKPGHGYGAVIGSGLSCFGEIMKSWEG